MAEKVGFFGGMLGGEWADRAAINKNAEELESVEADVSALRKTIARQADDILRLRAMVLGLAKVVQGKLQLYDDELERAVNEEWAQLARPEPKRPAPQSPVSTDPYRNLASGSDPTPEDVEAAKALLRTAEAHHFSKRFADARAAYEQIVERYGNTKQAATARQQIENLRSS